MRYYRINIAEVLFVVLDVPFFRIVIDLQGIQMDITMRGRHCYCTVVKAQVLGKSQQYRVRRFYAFGKCQLFQL